MPVSDGPRACPHCRGEIKGRVALCPHCGAVLDGTEPAAEEAAGPPAEEAAPAAARAPEGKKDRSARTCPSCKTELKGKVGICPVCGEWLGGAAPPPPPPPAAPAAGRPASGKMRPLPPGWPFVDTPKKDKGPAKKAKEGPEAPKGQARKAKGGAEAPKGQPATPRPGGPAAPAAQPAALGVHFGKREEPAPGPAPAPARPLDRPPEVKPWYVLQSTPEAKPAMPSRPAPEARMARPPRAPKPQAAAPSNKYSLLVWLGLLAGVVLLSVVVFGLVSGGLPLPHLGGASGGAARRTATAGENNTPTGMPTATGTATHTPTVAVTPTTPPTPTAAPQVHVVRPGESLSAIAASYGITVADLMAANNIKDANAIQAGQELKIPAGASALSTTPTALATLAAPTPTLGSTLVAPTATLAATVQATAEPAAFAFAAPNLLNPADGTVFRSGDDILLNWSSVGLLADDTWYVVKVWTDDPAQPTPSLGWTRTTAWRIPGSSRPAADAATHKYYWSVTVMRASEGQDPVAVSPASETRTFEWY